MPLSQAEKERIYKEIKTELDHERAAIARAGRAKSPRQQLNNVTCDDAVKEALCLQQEYLSLHIFCQTVSRLMARRGVRMGQKSVYNRVKASPELSAKFPR